MRKAIASAALAAMLSMGFGTAAMAQTDPAPAETEETTDDEGFELGLLGLLGLVGLAGLARGGRGRSSAPRSGGGKKPPRGGYNSDWSNR
ncbi:MAG TPA: WGxxGxxG family protein [Acidimicrobiales bacterium]|nr:WGxxGxxG family protein [Acidimicrobiales bacterium]